MDADDTDTLRRELLHRLDTHPMDDWSPGLLRAVIAVIDLGAQPLPMPPQPGGRVGLRVVG